MTDKAEKTNIEYFNEYMKMFVLEIKGSFPEFNDIIDGYYTELISSDSCNDDKYVKRFMRKLKDYKTQISGKDTSMFNGELCVLKNVDFEKIFASDILTENSREKIWEYLQTLYVLGESIISDSERVKNLVKNFQRLRDDTLGEEEATNECETEEDRELLDMLKNIAEQNQNTNSEPLSPEMFENGVIGKLAKELSEEINVESLGLNIDENTSADQMFSNLISGDNPMKFMNLLQTVGQKIQDKVSAEGIDQNDLINEATQMMGSLSGGGNSMFDALLKKAGGAAGAGGGGLGNLNPAQMNNPHSSGNATRDRLRKKLEKRNNQK